MRLFVTGRKRGASRLSCSLPPAVFPHFQILPDEPQHHRVNGNEPDLVALALDAEVHDALAALHVAQPQQAQLFAPDAVIEQGGEYRAVPYTLQRVRGRGLQQAAAPARRRAPACCLHCYSSCRPLHAVHRIAEDGVALTEIVKERGQRRELAADAGRRQAARLHVLAPGNDMRPRHGAERCGVSAGR